MAFGVVLRILQSRDSAGIMRFAENMAFTKSDVNAVMHTITIMSEVCTLSNQIKVTSHDVTFARYQQWLNYEGLWWLFEPVTLHT